MSSGYVADYRTRPAWQLTPVLSRPVVVQSLAPARRGIAMTKRLRTVLALACMGSMLGFASAAVADPLYGTFTADFDEFTGTYTENEDIGDYHDFNWSGFRVLDSTNSGLPSGTGYGNGAVSPDHYLVLDLDADFGQIQNLRSENDGLFTLDSAYLTAVWRNGLEVRVRGWADGDLKHDHTATVNTTEATFVEFDFDNIDTLTLSSSGGTFIGGSTSYEELFIVDDFTYTVSEPAVTPIPTPVASVAGLAAFGMIAMRRRHGHADRPRTA